MPTIRSDADATWADPAGRHETAAPAMVFWKTLIEWPVALVATTVLLPVFAIVAVAVRSSGPGPVIHRRRVLGRTSVPFDAFKFRTMVENADQRLQSDPQLRQAFIVRFKLPADPRVTRIGRVLRRYSLDELPQLINVLRGEMSLIGPRMITEPELARYGESGNLLLSVKPGLTGLWQTSGRQMTSYAERVRLDVQYIVEWSPWLDVKIALRTLPAVLRGQGAH